MDPVDFSDPLDCEQLWNSTGTVFRFQPVQGFPDFNRYRVSQISTGTGFPQIFNRYSFTQISTGTVHQISTGTVSPDFNRYSFTRFQLVQFHQISTGTVSLRFQPVQFHQISTGTVSLRFQPVQFSDSATISHNSCQAIANSSGRSVC